MNLLSLISLALDNVFGEGASSPDSGQGQGPDTPSWENAFGTQADFQDAAEAHNVVDSYDWQNNLNRYE